MLKNLFVLFFLSSIILSQTLVIKNEYKAEKAGALPEVNVVKNPTDDKIYVVTREAINKQLYIAIYDNSFKRLANLPATSELSVGNAFIRNGKLYFSDSKLKYISLSDFKMNVVNNDRKDISRYSLEELDGKDIILASDLSNWYLFDVLSNKEILNIKIKNTEKNPVRATIYDNDIYYMSEGNVVSRFSIKSNSISWSVRFPDKPVKILGIKLSSIPNTVIGINPYKKNNKDYIGITTLAGDYFTLDAVTGKFVVNEIQFERIDNMEQNNSKLFVNSYLFNDKINKELLIYAASIDENVYCLKEKDFSTVWETSTGNEIYSPLSFLDINNDSYPEVFGVNDYDENLFVMDGKTGKRLIFKSIKDGEQFNRTKVYLVDFYGTGELNLIVKTNNEKIKVFQLPSVHVPKNYIFSYENKN